MKISLTGLLALLCTCTTLALRADTDPNLRLEITSVPLIVDTVNHQTYYQVNFIAHGVHVGTSYKVFISYDMETWLQVQQDISPAEGDRAYQINYPVLSDHMFVRMELVVP